MRCPSRSSAARELLRLGGLAPAEIATSLDLSLGHVYDLASEERTRQRQEATRARFACAVCGMRSPTPMHESCRR